MALINKYQKAKRSNAKIHYLKYVKFPDFLLCRHSPYYDHQLFLQLILFIFIKIKEKKVHYHIKKENKDILFLFPCQ